MRSYYLIAISLLLSPAITQAQVQVADPTRPAGFVPTAAQPGNKQELNLTAIFAAPKQRLAIINGQLLAPGDTITRFRLLDIGMDSVRLQGPDGVLVLPLVNGPVKTPVVD